MQKRLKIRKHKVTKLMSKMQWKKKKKKREVKTSKIKNSQTRNLKKKCSKIGNNRKGSKYQYYWNKKMRLKGKQLENKQVLTRIEINQP